MGIKGAICYERIPFICWVLRGVLREVHGANAARFGRCRDIFLAGQPTQKQVLIGETQFCDWGVGRGLAISPANLTPYPSERGNCTRCPFSGQVSQHRLPQADLH
jgi:hypothetical protein